MNRIDIAKVHEVLDKVADFLTAPILWGIFAFAFLVTVIVSIALYYHWKMYASVHHKHLALAEKVYALVTVLILVFSLVLLLMYTL